jgi:short-subunit dehydrogenase
MPLDGQRIVVTGGSGGIGAPLVQLLVDNGANVITLGRKPGETRGVQFLQADLGEEASLLRAAAAVAVSEPDVLIHLAGSQYFGTFAGQSDAELLTSYKVNLLAPAILTCAAAAAMQRRGRGHVIFAGSVFGAIPFAHFAAYSSAKAGVAALCLALKREYAGSGIRFTHAVPRAVKTAMATAQIRKFAELAGFRFDTPESVAQRLFDTVVGGHRDPGPGFPESLFMRLSAIAPGLVSRGLVGTDRKARLILALTPQSSKE